MRETLKLDLDEELCRILRQVAKQQQVNFEDVVVE
jgi:hypothetical protein